MPQNDTLDESENLGHVSIRLNDVIVGIITGAICSVFAAGFEGFVMSIRIFSFGRIGGSIGSQFFVILLLGAIAGAVIGWLVGSVVKPRGNAP